MSISLLQLNINADNFWDMLTQFLTTHDFDVLQLQEIIGKDTVTGNIHCKRDCFADLQALLGEKYTGVLAIGQRYTSSPTSYFGNATFYKKTLPLVAQNIVTIYEHPEPFDSNSKSFERIGRNLIHLQLSIASKTVSFLNTHFAWSKTPIEQPHQTEQGEVLLNYLKTVPQPFIFSGDLNLTPEQPFIQKLNQLGHNLTTENNLTNTLNPRTHYVKQLFPAGLAVDYIFTSPDLKTTDFHVIEEDISDHFGLAATIQL